MAVNTFEQLLTMFGFNGVTTAMFLAQGVVSLHELQHFSQGDLESWFHSLTRIRAPLQKDRHGNDLPLEDQVQFPFLAMKKLKSLRQWCQFKIQRGQMPNERFYDRPTMTRWMIFCDHISAEKLHEESLPAVDALKSLSAWPM